MDINELNKRRVPIVVIDKRLDKYKGINFFPEKLEKANETLKRVGLPKTQPGKLMAAEPKAKYLPIRRKARKK